MRTKVDWRSASRDVYKDFRKQHPTIKVSFEQWRDVVYSFNELFRDYILETGEKVKMPSGFGDFSINKKKREKFKEKDGKQHINLAIDWKRSKEKGKKVYLFNYHTEGYFFGWMWFKYSAMLKFVHLWYFKPCRATSRLLSHYLLVDNKYQKIYREWKN